MFIFEDKKHEKCQILDNIDDSMLKKPIRTVLEPVIKNSANAVILILYFYLLI